MANLIVPSNMFLYTQNGIFGREINTSSITGASLWLEQLNLKIGVFDEKAIFKSIEYYIPDLFYWYKYECVFSYDTPQIYLSSINCLYYRKININGVEQQLTGRFPHYIELTHPRITYDIRIYLSKFGHLIVQHLVYLLNLYTPNDKIEMEGLTELFTPMIEMYLNHLDQHITDSNESIIRLITTLNFSTLEKIVTPESAERIMETLLKYIEQPDEVIQNLPSSLCINLIMTADKNMKRYKFRDELTQIARKTKRTDLCNIMIPSPLRTALTYRQPDDKVV